VLVLYGFIGVVAGLAQVLYLLAAFVLSAHLLARARRTRDLAPLLLGIQLLFAMGFGYLLCAAGTGIALLSHAPSPRLVAGLLATGNASTMIGLSAALVFSWRVFSPGERWPLWLGGAFAASMLAGWLGSAASGAFETVSYANGWFLLLNAGMLAINLWVGIEPLVYYAKLRKRVRLGLAEPLIVDRFLLWGLGSLARAALVVMGPIGELCLRSLGEEGRQAFTTVSLAISGLLGLSASVSYWLTFNPTPAYVRWVQRRYRSGRTA
jgi:hypothetical protein